MTLYEGAVDASVEEDFKKILIKLQLDSLNTLIYTSY